MLNLTVFQTQSLYVLRLKRHYQSYLDGLSSIATTTTTAAVVVTMMTVVIAIVAVQCV
jgi:ABC-type multidrug transport system permease subunit